ncbi:hypothetical protein [uncultured Aliiroseovarius sp.]|nr:hypothetical protein [uncultured Aliiroseovarius sp.]MCI2398976.1 hypothetical protein [Aliiroseovarius subalbicans]
MCKEVDGDQPAFIEEFYFRIILQGKLERVVGLTRGRLGSVVLHLLPV